MELDSLFHVWEERIERLEKEGKQIEENQDSMVKADTPAVRERVRPNLEKKTIQRCIEDIKDCGDTDDMLVVLGEWRDEAEERDKRILNSNEWFRNHYTRPCLDARFCHSQLRYRETLKALTTLAAAE